jgi:hypothetical protein
MPGIADPAPTEEDEPVAELTEAEWERLGENFETASLLQAVDAVDTLRTQLSDGDGNRRPEIRDRLLKLHQLAMDVINRGQKGKAYRRSNRLWRSWSSAVWACCRAIAACCSAMRAWRDGGCKL